MRYLKKRRIFVGIAVGLLVLATAIIIFNSYVHDQITRSKLLDRSLSEVVEDPETGLWTVSNELIIIGDLELANRVAKRYRGVIFFNKLQKEGYQIAFPVKSLDELKDIKHELENEGIEVWSSSVVRPF